MVDLMGIQYGPLVVTPLDQGSGPALHCPACRGTFRCEDKWLGCEIRCPNPHCATPLRVNSFVVRGPETPSPKSVVEHVHIEAKMPTGKKKTWQFWKR